MKELIKELRAWMSIRPDLTQVLKAELRGIIERAEARHEAEQGEGLREAIAIMENARNHGGPVSYADADDSVGSYVCCGGASYKDHNKDCWYRKMCEFLDSHPTPAKPTEPLAVLADRKGYHISRQVCRFKTTSPEWIINLEPNVYEHNPANFFQPTYALAEAKARAYLTALADKGGK